MTDSTQIAIAGAGPAGLLAAHALSKRGVSVVVCDPGLETPWANRYAVWADEWAELHPEIGDDALLSRRWSTFSVHPGGPGGSPATLDRAYAFVDAPALQQRLRTQCESHGVRFFDSRIDAVDHSTAGSRIELERSHIDCRAFVDATGTGGPWLKGRRQPRSFQTAYGILADTTTRGGLYPDLPSDSAVLMDWRSPIAQPPNEPPSFLYALPIAAGRWWLEETVLLSSAALPPARLARRLHQRLDAMGVTVERVHDTEHCRIPMDLAVPHTSQRTIAFGSAAGMVHPATGYQLAYTASRAPALADALAKGIAHGRSARQLSRAAWKAVWPTAALRRRRLFTFGARVLDGLNQQQTQHFFDAFFSVDPARSAAYLSRRATTLGVARTMLDVYRSSPPKLRKLLRAGGLSRAHTRSRSPLSKLHAGSPS